MTTTCLPPEAYYHLNSSIEPQKPRFREPGDPETQALLDEIGVRVGSTREWESAYRLSFGNRAYEEDYSTLDWRDPSSWEDEAARFREAFLMADGFVFDVMHRLYPYQQKEMIPAITHALMAWSSRRRCPLPLPFDEGTAITLLTLAGYGDMAQWLNRQQ
jgi:hypothetical protein